MRTLGMLVGVFAVLLVILFIVDLYNSYANNQTSTLINIENGKP